MWYLCFDHLAMMQVMIRRASCGLYTCRMASVCRTATVTATGGSNCNNCRQSSHSDFLHAHAGMDHPDGAVAQRADLVRLLADARGTGRGPVTPYG